MRLGHREPASQNEKHVVGHSNGPIFEVDGTSVRSASKIITGDNGEFATKLLPSFPRCSMKNQGMMCRRRGPEPEQRERGNKEANMLPVCVYKINDRAWSVFTPEAGSAGLDNAAVKCGSPGSICEDLRCARFILIEQLLHERRIEVRPDLHDFFVIKPADPTIPVSEWRAI